MLLWIWIFGGLLIIRGTTLAQTRCSVCRAGALARRRCFWLCGDDCACVGTGALARPSQAKIMRGIPSDSIGFWLQSGAVPINDNFWVARDPGAISRAPPISRERGHFW